MVLVPSHITIKKEWMDLFWKVGLGWKSINYGASNVQCDITAGQWEIFANYELM